MQSLSAALAIVITDDLPHAVTVLSRASAGVSLW